MPFGDDIVYRPQDPDKRGRHRTVVTAFDAALKDLLTERNPFFDSLVAKWPELFPGLKMFPGRCDGSTIYLYVRTASLSFLMRPRLPAIRAKVAAMPGAPKRLSLRLEIHAQ